MAVRSGTLSDGQVKTSSSVIYTVPDTVANTLITYLGFLNTSSVEQTIFIRVQRKGGTSRKMRRFTLKQNFHGQWISRSEEPTLSPGDRILMETTTASIVDYVLCGTETLRNG